MSLCYMNPIWHEGYGTGQSWSRRLSHRRYAIIEMDNVEIPQTDSHQDSLVLNNPQRSSFPLHTWLAPIKRAFHPSFDENHFCENKDAEEKLCCQSVFFYYSSEPLLHIWEKQKTQWRAFAVNAVWSSAVYIYMLGGTWLGNCGLLQYWSISHEWQVVF